MCPPPPAGHRVAVRCPRHQVLHLGAPLCPQDLRLPPTRAVSPEDHQVPGRGVRVHLGRAACGRLHPHLPHLRAAGTPAHRHQGTPSAGLKTPKLPHLETI